MYAIVAIAVAAVAIAVAETAASHFISENYDEIEKKADKLAAAKKAAK